MMYMSMSVLVDGVVGSHGGVCVVDPDNVDGVVVSCGGDGVVGPGAV